MKLMKKLLAALLPLVMALGMTVTAFAEGNGPSITAPANGHTYEVYQIFTGDIADGQLANIKWGANGTGETGKFVSADITEELAALKDSTSDAEKLAAITQYVNLEDTPLNTLTKGATLLVPAGYYLIKDVDGSQSGKDDSYTLYLAKVAGSVVIAPKTSTPSVEKKVQENSDNAWQDAADYNIGDNVPFKLTATLGDVTSYQKYYLQFVDTVSSGLTFNNDVTVTIDDVEISSGFVVAPTDAGFTVTFEDVLALGATSESEIVVSYTARLNANAVIGRPGNPNEVKLVYSNNPNVDGNGQPSEGHGETPEDKVTVFTYKLIANKVDGNGDALEGAGFTLYKGTGETKVQIGDEITGVTTFTFRGLDAGQYTLVETTVPTGYNQADDIVFTITAVYDKESANPALTELTVNPAGGFTIEIAEGSLETDVVNYTGATLPETGGMGTTLFYVVGGMMMIGAAVLLITKKRMEA